MIVLTLAFAVIIVLNKGIIIVGCNHSCRARAAVYTTQQRMHVTDVPNSCMGGTTLDCCKQQALPTLLFALGLGTMPAAMSEPHDGWVQVLQVPYAAG